MVNDFDNVQNATVDLCIRVVNEKVYCPYCGKKIEEVKNDDKNI